MKPSNKYLDIHTYVKPAQGLLVATLLLTASTPSAEPAYAQESDGSNQIMLPLIQNGQVESDGLLEDDNGAGPFNMAQSIDPDLTNALSAALHDHEHDEAETDEEHKIVGVEQYGDIAIAYVTESINGIATGHPHVVMARYEKPEWQIIFDDDSQFTDLITRLPDTVYDETTKSMLRVEPAREVRAAMSPASGYLLPWRSGQSAIVTQSYRSHQDSTGGQIDFVIPNKYSEVLAAKDGRIVYINDSNRIGGNHAGYIRYNNAVVIEHGEREFTIYLHLAHNSVPKYIQDSYKQTKSVSVKRGTIIGKQGSTGWSTGAHLHLSTTVDYYVSSQPDHYDQDRDGNRSELVETAWTKEGHRTVNFDEASYSKLFWWEVGTGIESKNAVYTPSNPSSAIVQNIRTSSGRTYNLGECKVGGKLYTDRNYTFTEFSNSDYKNRPCIITANNDKKDGSNDLLTFELTKPATIRILIDRRMDRKPSWFGNKYNKNSKKVHTTDSSMKYFEVYTCEAKPGWITLGGPQRGSKGVESMYVVQIKEVSKGRTNCSTK